MPPNSICPRCFNQIDTDVCWCGDYEDAPCHGGSIHTYEHSFVPMGCTCGYADPTKNPWEALIDEDL